MRERPEFPTPGRIQQTAKYKVELNADALLHSRYLFYFLQLQVSIALVALVCVGKMQKSPADLHIAKFAKFNLCL